MIITILEIKGEITIKRASMRRMTSIRIGHIIKKKRIMKRMTKDQFTMNFLIFLVK